MDEKGRFYPAGSPTRPHLACWGQIAVFMILAIAIVSLSGCGTEGVVRSLAVADRNNNRILIYLDLSGLETALNFPSFTTDEPADSVIGQADFTHNAPNRGGTLDANTLNLPSGVAMDSKGDLTILDTGNCRALQAYTAKNIATVVIGEPDFVTSNCLSGGAATPSSLFNPTGAAFDSGGNLWVADFGDSRILEYVPPFSNGMAASLVLGQTSLTGSAGCNRGLGAPTAGTLCSPHQISFDAAGNLWVADYGNNRVLEFVPPFSNGMAATLELGQPAGSAFTSNTANNGGVSASSLNGPVQPQFDSRGNLWVSDSANNRVLRFVPPFSNGMAATLELGQPPGATAFTTNAAGTTRNTLNTPAGITFGHHGELIVSDYHNNRVEIFLPSFSNGMASSIALGQSSSTSGAPNRGGTVAADTLYGPVGLAYH